MALTRKQARGWCSRQREPHGQGHKRLQGQQQGEEQGGRPEHRARPNRSGHSSREVNGFRGNGGSDPSPLPIKCEATVCPRRTSFHHTVNKVGEAAVQNEVGPSSFYLQANHCCSVWPSSQTRWPQSRPLRQALSLCSHVLKGSLSYKGQDCCLTCPTDSDQPGVTGPGPTTW